MRYRERVGTEERTSRDTVRKPQVAQVFSYVTSLEELASAVMCDMDEARSETRCFF